MSKYSEALEAFEAGFENETVTGCRMWGFNLPVEKAKDVMQALRIADRLERGDVSDEMSDVAFKSKNAILPMPTTSFKAMAQQLLREEEQELTSSTALLKEEENK